MNKKELVHRLTQLEWEDFEVKSAQGGLPKSVWETVSAFANTNGGWLVLGVGQIGTDFEINGVGNAEKMEQDFLGILRGAKFNVFVPSKQERFVFGDKKVLAFYIPPHARKPVYFNVQSNTYIRRGSADQKASPAEIDAMLRDQAFGTRSSICAPESSRKDIHARSLERYRNYMARFNPDAGYNRYGDAEFLQKLRIADDEGCTYAGLLMLGKRETIEKHFPDFRIDLLEIPGTSYTDSQQRYTYRIDEQENLWEYYFECFSRLKQKIDVQFILGSEGFGQELSPGLEGIREALVNMLMHADYFSPAKSRIRIFSDRIEFFNPGGLPKPFAELKNRDMSLPRNPILAKLFRMVRLAENAGFGLDKMDERWRQYNNTVPLYGIEFDSVSLTFNLRPTAADGSAGVIAGELNAKEAHEAAYDTAHDGAHDLSPTESAILTACRGGPQSSQELLIALGYSTRTGNFKKALARLNHDLGLVEPTVPGALRSRHQKYRLSDKGRALLEKS